jgi:hypothetical protein
MKDANKLIIVMLDGDACNASGWKYLKRQLLPE